MRAIDPTIDEKYGIKLLFQKQLLGEGS